MELRPRALVTVEIVVYHDDVFPDTVDEKDSNSKSINESNGNENTY